MHTLKLTDAELNYLYKAVYALSAQTPNEADNRTNMKLFNKLYALSPNSYLGSFKNVETGEQFPIHTFYLT